MVFRAPFFPMHAFYEACVPTGDIYTLKNSAA